LNFTAYFLSWELFELQKRMIPPHQWYSIHRFHFISDTLYITVGNRDYTCTNTFSPEQSQVMLKKHFGIQNMQIHCIFNQQRCTAHNNFEWWTKSILRLDALFWIIIWAWDFVSKNNIIFSLSILSNYHSTITSHFQWTTHSFLFLYMTTSLAHSDETGEIFRKVMLSDSDRLFCLDFLSLFELQFK
jgi:hypothetical protein